MWFPDPLKFVDRFRLGLFGKVNQINTDGPARSTSGINLREQRGQQPNRKRTLPGPQLLKCRQREVTIRLIDQKVSDLGFDTSEVRLSLAGEDTPQINLLDEPAPGQLVEERTGKVDMDTVSSDVRGLLSHVIDDNWRLPGTGRL